jgi:hypothetical protein
MKKLLLALAAFAFLATAQAKADDTKPATDSTKTDTKKPAKKAKKSSKKKADKPADTATAPAK